MDISKLEIFDDLAQTCNYTETAEHLYTTQGNISKQIIALEKELGVQLFSREHRKIQLTDAGKIALNATKNILSDYEQLKENLFQYKSNQNLTITLFTIPTMSNYYDFHQITAFLKIHPEITIHIEEHESVEIFSALENKKCDLIFARTFSGLPDDLEQVSKEEDQFVAVLPINHPLASRTAIHLSELKNDNFLLLGKETNLINPVYTLCKEAGFEPRITYEGLRVEIIMNMISSELGVTLLMSETIKHLLNDQTIAVPITPTQHSQLSFIRLRKENSGANQLFWNYLTSH